MKLILNFFLLILFTTLVNASDIVKKEFISRVLPLEIYTIKSTISGEVVFTNTKIEGKQSHNNTIIKIDKELNLLELKQINEKLKITNNMLKIESNNYSIIRSISSKSQFEKDSQKLKVLNLQSTMADLTIKLDTLKNIIKHKTLINKDNYIYNIYVKSGDYVNPGTKLYEAYDLSKAKLIIFIAKDDKENIKNKTIYLNGDKTDYKIDKLYYVADSKYISRYKCEIIIKCPKDFSKLVKIEFK
jgi:hypothetical protein